MLGLASVFFVATKWNAVRSAAESIQAVAVITAVGIAWLVFSFLVMPRIVKRQWLRVAITTVAAIALAWVMFANAYQNKTVVERLDGLRTAPRAEQLADSPVGAAGTAGTAVTPEPTAAPAPVRVRSAAFRGIDHRASGTGSIIRQPNGSYVVGLENIDFEPGPDYFVYVVPGNATRLGDGAVQLDKLRGNQGTQFYDVPSGTNPTDGEWTVLVWCRVFAVPIAAAVPQ